MAAVLLWQPALRGAERTFTDNAGRRVKAEIAGYRGSDQVILKKGRKEFPFAISKLSEDDQKFVRNWIKANPGAAKFSFTFFADLRTSKGNTQKVVYDARVQRQPKQYSMTITERNKANLEGLRVEYQILIEDYVDMTSDRYKRLALSYSDRTAYVQRIMASHTVGKTKRPGRIDIDTDTFTTEKYVDRDGTKVDVAFTDKVIGLWVRVYKGDVLVGEFKDAQNRKMDKLQWKPSSSDRIVKLEPKE